MFTTYSAFKFPVQFDKEAPSWLAVELTLNAPWFIAECVDGDFTRSFLLDGAAELSLFIERAPFGSLDTLSLVFPPAWSRTGEWELLKIERVDRNPEAPLGSPLSLVFVAEGGGSFSDMPLQEFRGEPGACTLLLQLPDSRNSEEN